MLRVSRADIERAFRRAEIPLRQPVKTRYMGRGGKSRWWRCTRAVTGRLATEEHQLSLSRPTNLSSRWTRLWFATILQIEILLKLPQIWQFIHFKSCPPTPPLLIHLLILLQILQRMTARVRRAAAGAATNPSDSTNKRMSSDSAPLPPPPPSAPRLSSCPSSVQDPSSSA